MRPLVADIFHVLKDAEQGGYFMSTPEIHRELCRSDPDPPVVKTVLRTLQRLLDQQLVESEKRGTALSRMWPKLR